jgi:hypothetical protein
MDATRGRSSQAPEDTDDGVLLDEHDDRWEWRRRIRSDPRKHRIYRGVVGSVGVALILLAGATGWLPGPGGIPLALLGLAVLASEFEWAQNVLEGAKVKVHELGRWIARQPVWVRSLGSVLTGACVVAAIWLSLSVFGVPGWAPESVSSFLAGVPGLG